MNGDVIFNVVDNLDEYGIILSGKDSWTRELAIHCHNGL